MIKKNVGNVDRIARAIFGIVIIGAGFYYQSWWGLVGLIPLATAAIGSCLLYRILGVSTCPAGPASVTPNSPQG